MHRAIKLISCFFLLLSLGVTVVTAQADSLSNIPEFDVAHFYFAGQVGIPSKELQKAINNDFGNLGAGLSAGILFNPFGKKQVSPLLVGVDFEYITYGVDKIAKTSTTPPLKTAFNVYCIGASGRVLIGQRKGFAPFIDGTVGVKIFNTRTKIDKDALDIILNTNQPEVLNTTNDNSLNYGLGIGFFNRKVSNDNSTLRASFTARIMYSWGANARYVIRDSITVDSNNNVQFQTGYTQTDMVLVQVGFVLY